MPAPRVLVDHDQLNTIQNIFAAQANAVQEIIRDLKAGYGPLQSGGWIGQGANKYFEEMDGMVFPILRRLQNALEEAGRATERISQIFLDAEQEAANVLRPGQQSTGPALGGAGAAGLGGAGAGAAGGAGGGAAGGAGGGAALAKDPAGQSRLLGSFAARFPEAAALIGRSQAARRLVAEAQAAGVEFGGFAEDAPASNLGRAHTVGNRVYVPRSSTDRYLAARDFLFELNNAMRHPRFAAVNAEARRGSAGTLTAQQYAYRMTELEVEGSLRLAQVWTEMKRSLGGGAELNQYDRQFYLPDYQRVSEGRLTRDALVREVMSRPYDTGTVRGTTVEQYYRDWYRRLSGGR